MNVNFKKLGMLGCCIFLCTFFAIIEISRFFLPTLNTQNIIATYFCYYLINILAILSLFMFFVSFALMVPHWCFKIVIVLIGIIISLLTLLKPTKDMNTFIVNEENKNMLEVVLLLKDDLINQETMIVEIPSDKFYIEEVYKKELKTHRIRNSTIIETYSYFINIDNKYKTPILSGKTSRYKLEENETCNIVMYKNSGVVKTINGKSLKEYITEHEYAIKETENNEEYIKEEIEKGNLYELTWSGNDKILINQKLKIENSTEEEIAKQYTLYCYCDDEMILASAMRKELDIPLRHMNGVYIIYVKEHPTKGTPASNVLKYEFKDGEIIIIE